jgi:hypothetical protein
MTSDSITTFQERLLLRRLSRLAPYKLAARALKTIGIAAMSDAEESQEQVKEKVAALELEHRDLDEVIINLEKQGDFDQLKLSRLKKRKLALKDQISGLRDKLLPDIIA